MHRENHTSVFLICKFRFPGIGQRNCGSWVCTAVRLLQGSHDFKSDLYWVVTKAVY